MDFPTDVDASPLRELRLRGVEVSKSPFPLSGSGSTVSLAARSLNSTTSSPRSRTTWCAPAEAAVPDNVVEGVAARNGALAAVPREDRPEGLSPEERAGGLFGELWFLTGQLIPAVGMLAAVEARRGPLGGVQDFQAGEWAVEVKTTRQAAPAAIRIASERQLQSDGLEFLGLVIVALKPPGGRDADARREHGG